MKAAWHIFRDSSHKDVLSIAIPMILSNITIPLLGLVDAAVIGHLEHPGYLGGVALGSVMINVVLWIVGFLRMTTTGISAQAYGAKNNSKQVQILLQGSVISILLSILILTISGPVSSVALGFSDASSIVKRYAEQYFVIRMISSPAALINLVFMGWLLGGHEAHKVMKLLIFVNIINIILDLVFVPGLKMGVKGAAIASVIADYAGLVMGVYYIYKTWLKLKLPKITFKMAHVFEDVMVALKLNLDIFTRSFFLQMVFVFMAFKGASLGDNIAAANAILMNFLIFISYVMDGFAYAMEALVGSSLGARDKSKLQKSLIIAAFWSLIVSLICTLIFAAFGKNIIGQMTSIETVRFESIQYLPWLVAFPLIAMWSFLLDGLFVGGLLGREMRNGMIVSVAIFFITYLVLHNNGNHALWASMLVFMASRWVILICILKVKRIKLIP